MPPIHAARSRGGHSAAESSGRAMRSASDARTPSASTPCRRTYRRNRCGDVSRKRSFGSGCEPVTRRRAVRFCGATTQMNVSPLRNGSSPSFSASRNRSSGSGQASRGRCEPLEGHAQPRGEDADIVVFADDACSDQDAVCASPECDGALFGSGKRSGRQSAAQTIEFGATGAAAALWTEAGAARLRHEGPGTVRRRRSSGFSKSTLLKPLPRHGNWSISEPPTDRHATSKF